MKPPFSLPARINSRGGASLEDDHGETIAMLGGDADDYILWAVNNAPALCAALEYFASIPLPANAARYPDTAGRTWTIDLGALRQAQKAFDEAKS
jgi:hypothetical protein